MLKSLKYFAYLVLLIVLAGIFAIIIPLSFHCSIDFTIQSLIYLSILAHIVFIATVFIKKELTPEDTFELKKVPWLVLALCLILIMSYMVLQLFSFDMFDMPEKSDFTKERVRIDFLSSFLLIGIIVPIAEEIYFRGILLNALLKLKIFINKPWIAILISSAVFSLAHIVWVAIPFFFIGGILLAWCKYRTNSLLPSILMHAFNNSLIVIGIFLTINDTSNTTRDDSFWNSIVEISGSNATAIAIFATFIILFITSIVSLKKIFDRYYIVNNKDILAD